MKTRDILFVAWLEVAKSITFDTFNVIDARNGNIAEFEYINLDDNSAKKLKLEFLSSETMKTKYALRKIKDTIN
jgi:hypothetical protein